MDDKLCEVCGLARFAPELTLAHGWLEYYGGCECDPPQQQQLILFPGECALLGAEE